MLEFKGVFGARDAEFDVGRRQVEEPAIRAFYENARLAYELGLTSRR